MERIVAHQKSKYYLRNWLLFLILGIALSFSCQAAGQSGRERWAILELARQVSAEAWVVFVSTRTGNWDIFKLRLGSTEPIQLTSSPEIETEPEWSPDGRWILFRRGDRLAVMDAQGKNLRFLGKVSGEMPSWAPDGRRILYVFQKELYVVDVVSGKRSLLALSAKVKGWLPRLSPDNRHILLCVPSWSVRKVEISTGKETFIGQGCEGSFSPDGKFISHIYQGHKVFAVRTAKGKLVKKFPLPKGKISIDHPRWSNHSDYIAFAAGTVKNDHWGDWDVFIQNIHTGMATRLTFNRKLDSWPDLYVYKKKQL